MADLGADSSGVEAYLDWPRLVGRVNGKVATARRLLEGFLKDYRDVVAETRAALGAGDRKEARRLIHRLAGTAGNLALPAVAAAARACEDLVASAGTDFETNWSRASSRLEASLAATGVVVDRFLRTLPPGLDTPFPTSEDAGELKARLQALLATNDIAALNVVERWKAARPRPSAWAEEVFEAVNALDFARAGVLLANEAETEVSEHE